MYRFETIVSVECLKSAVDQYFTVSLPLSTARPASRWDTASIYPRGFKEGTLTNSCRWRAFGVPSEPLRNSVWL